MSGNQSNNKRIAKNTMMLYFRMLLTMGVSLYTSRVILNTLGVEDYGIYGVVGGVIWMFSFITNSMSGATQRFLTFELGKGNKELSRKVFNISLEIYVFLAIMIFILGETVGLWFVQNKLVIPEARMDAALWVYQASVVTCMFTIITIPFNAAIISHEKMAAFAYISIYEVITKLVIVYLLLLFSFDKLKLYAILILVVQVSISLIYQIYSRRHFVETQLKFYYDKDLLLQMSGFAGWTLFGNVACIGYTQGINIVLNMFFGPVVNAARAVASQVEGVVNGFVSNFQTALNPQIVKNYAMGDLPQMHNLVFASCRYSFLLLFLLSLPIYIEAPTILEIWLKTVPNHTVNFLRITMIALLVGTQANPIMTAAGATGDIRKYQIVCGGLLLMILPFVYIVLKLGANAEAALIVYLFFIILAQIARFWMIRTMINLSMRQYIHKVLFPIVGVVGMSAVLPVVLKISLPETFVSSLIICFSCVVMTLISIISIGITSSERALVVKKLKSVF